MIFVLLYFIVGIVVYNTVFDNLFYNRKYESKLLELIDSGLTYKDIDNRLFLYSLLWPIFIIYILINIL